MGRGAMNLSQHKPCNRCGLQFKRPPKISENQWQLRSYCSKACSATKTTIDPNDLIRLYWAEMKSSAEIAEILGVSSVHVLRLMRQHRIRIRSQTDSLTLSHSRGWVKEKISKAKLGVPLPESAKENLRQRTGAKNHNWTGGMTVTNGGYIYFTASPANGDNANKALHVVIAEMIYGKKVVSGNHVHHIDGNKLNNSPENLCVLNASDHAKIHTEDRKNGKRLKQL